MLGQTVNSTKFAATSRYCPRVRLAVEMREFTLLWLMAMDSEMKKLLRFAFLQRGKSLCSWNRVLSDRICFHNFDSRRMNMKRSVFLDFESNWTFRSRLIWHPATGKNQLESLFCLKQVEKRIKLINCSPMNHFAIFYCTQCMPFHSTCTRFFSFLIHCWG